MHDDDYLFVESEDSEWTSIMKNVKGLYTWGKHEYGSFVLCGVQYRQHSDWSVSMDQREYVDILSPMTCNPMNNSSP